MQSLRRLSTATLLALFLFPAIGHAETKADNNDALATAFGSYPFLWNVRLSPNGAKVSYLHMADVDGGLPVLVVMDVESGEQTAVLSSIRDKFDIRWCRWANDTRLLCSFYGIDRMRNLLVPMTRMVALDSDGANTRVLLQDRLRDTFTQFQDDVVDWMPDDPEHILIEMPDATGTGVSRVNIYTGKVSLEERARKGTREWRSDGRGVARLRLYRSDRRNKWFYRVAGDDNWEELHDTESDDAIARYYPLGFGEDLNELLVLKPHEGRMALWSENLADNRKDTLIFAHPDVDVDGTARIGKYNRLIAASYVTDAPDLEYFDPHIEDLHARVSKAVPGKIITIYDESWDRRYYLIHVSSDLDPGTYYRLDTETNRMVELHASKPRLQNLELAQMQSITYPAQDAVEVPGYLTMPSGGGDKNLPVVIMPHGGPESRDVLGFDWLAQFMAAKGYVVLQSNFRGSGGYGTDWSGDGAFREWRQAISDISDGTRWLIAEGIADPERICIVGWSYGGYAALMSVIEEPELYKCAVSVAGVMDPLTLIRDAKKYIGGRQVKEFVGMDSEIIKHGSPAKRAKEVQVPVLLFHGDKDINVDVDHSELMHKKLRKAKKSTELIIYEDVEHDLGRESYRIDMLNRVGQFLQQNIGD